MGISPLFHVNIGFAGRRRRTVGKKSPCKGVQRPSRIFDRGPPALAGNVVVLSATDVAAPETAADAGRFDLMHASHHSHRQSIAQ
ncbi:hypothetical protein BWR18_19230 [Tateyamaria omphalii]|uniref:Uncharacterized protein n=1 Tax=Tateyamaria omphalii TaxID=299262 RepID=A0A1P8MZQ5_9RHOB|nr:hypothetical protein BWR18_19230 [Tateyamaria omphalii]